MAGLVQYWPLLAGLGGFVAYTVVQLFSLKAEIVELRTRLDAHKDWHDGKVPGDPSEQPLPAGSQHLSMTFGPNQVPSSYGIEGQRSVSRDEIDQAFKRKLKECGVSDLKVATHLGGDLGLPYSPQTIVYYPEDKNSLNPAAAACLEQKVRGLGFPASSIRLYFLWTVPVADGGGFTESPRASDSGKQE